MSTLIAEFISESAESLDRVDQDFVALEKRPGDREILARIFRAVHTVKGSCGFLGFSRLEALAHSGESLLGMLRDGTLALTPAITTKLLETMDGIRASLEVIESTGGEGDRRHDTLIAELDALREGKRVTPTPAAAATSTSSNAPPKPAGTPVPWQERVEDLRRALLDLDKALAGLREPSSWPRIAAALDEIASAAEGSVALVDVACRAAKLASGPDSSGREEAILEAAVFLDDALASIDATNAAPYETPPQLLAILGGPSVAPPAPPAPITAGPAPAGPAPAPAAAASVDRHREESASRRTSIADSKIRVDVRLLDSLMNQVGELVLARNQILQSLQSRDGRVPTRITQRLSQITTDLQAGVMRTRLQPMEIVWNRFPRTVRDLGLELGKRVELVMDGADTELDRSLLEAIRDPMTHLVRNALDHGIETEAERIAAGKKPVGSLSLRAWHEGGQVNIEIEDDGRGIDVARIEQKALARGLITPEQARAMSHQEKVALIFLPGFSTKEQVTTVSGRGVGMDVVKNNIDQVNGAIDIQTEVGRGTSFRLKIPLTLAIIPALIVHSAGEQYVIPQVGLLAVVSLTGSGAERGIEYVHDAAVFRWRDRLLPIVDLGAVLMGRADTSPREAGAITVVVLQAADRRFGLMVDAVVDSAEVVVKPISRVLTRTRVFAAATIMGDGRAAMILDVLGLAQRVAVVTGRAERASTSRAMRHTGAVAPSEDQQALIVRVGRDLAVVPLTSAIRLEHFPARAVERYGGRPVAQYRERVLPLRHLEGHDLLVMESDGVLNVVVYTEGEHGIGLVVDELVDIIRGPTAIQRVDGRRHGVIGATIVQDRVAQVLDLPALAREVSA